MAGRQVIPEEQVSQAILHLRGQRVILDADLARLYGVSTKALNQAVKRNPERFPDDFRFQLNSEERDEVVTICDHLAQLKFSKSLPFAFTEHGALMAASVLNSERAIQASVWVIRGFVKLRVFVASHAELARKINDLEEKVDAQFKAVFDAIRALMQPAEDKPRERIGFVPRRKDGGKQSRRNSRSRA